MLRHCFVVTVFFVFAVLVSGCGGGADENRRYPVQVKVTLDGKPMVEGQVDFVPLDGRVPSSGLITEGQAQFGSVAGKCRVEILAFRKVGNMREVENYLPKRYSERSQLTAEVVAGGENQFAFQVTSK